MPSQRTRLETLVAFSILLVPLLSNPFGYAPAGRLKDGLVWLAAGVALLLVASVAGQRRSPAHIRPPARLVIPAMFWLLAVTVATFKAPAWRPALASVAGYLPYIAFAAAAGTVARRPRGRRLIVRAVAASAGLLPLAWFALRLLSVAWPRMAPDRVLAPYAEPTLLAAFLACAFPFTVAVGLERRPPRWAASSCALCVAGIVSLMQPFALAAAALGLLVTLYATRGAHTHAPLVLREGLKEGAGSPHRLISLPRRLIAGLALALLFIGTDRALPNSASREPFANQLTVLRAHWTTAMTLFPKRMVLGWGADGYRLHAPTYSRDAGALDMPLVSPHPTAGSEWYTAAVEGGLVGALAWAVLVLSIMSAASDLGRASSPRLRIAASARPVAAAVFGSTAAFVAQGSALPRSPLTSLMLVVAWGLTWGLLVAGRPRVNKSPRLRVCGSPVLAAAAIPMLVVGAGIIAADTVAGAAARAAAAGRPSSALTRFAIAAWLDPLEPAYRDVWGQYALRVAASGDALLRIQGADAALSAWGPLGEREPKNGLWKAALAEARAYREPQTAWDDVVAALRLSPQSSTAWARAATVCRLAGRRQDEKDALRAAVTYGPLEASPFYRLAGIFERENRADLVALLTSRAQTESARDPAMLAWRRKSEALSYDVCADGAASTWHKRLSDQRP